MSRHHRATKHTSATYHLRPELEAKLPLPCTECGRAVEKGTPWHVSHLTAAEHGGRTTRSNVGAAHARCNLRDGGRRGARAVNRHRRGDAREGIRAW